jgi:hypothetical protein
LESESKKTTQITFNFFLEMTRTSVIFEKF